MIMSRTSPQAHKYISRIEISGRDTSCPNRFDEGLRKTGRRKGGIEWRDGKEKRRISRCEGFSDDETLAMLIIILYIYIYVTDFLSARLLAVKRVYADVSERAGYVSVC